MERWRGKDKEIILKDIDEKVSVREVKGVRGEVKEKSKLWVMELGSERNR